MSDGPFPPGSRLAAYLRASGGDDQDLSIDQQERALGEWCREYGYTLTRVFKDVRSGTSTTGRREFLRMIDYFHGKPPEVGIVFWKYDRLARDYDDAQFHKSDLRHEGVILHSLHDNIPEGLDGRVFESLIDWKNQKFIHDLKANVRRGMRDIMRVFHAWPYGRTPKGYMREYVVVGKRLRSNEDHIVPILKPDPDTAPLVTLAFQMRAEGRGYSEIFKATRLYSAQDTYSHLLSKRIYTGDWEFPDGEIIEEYCPPLVDKETWQAVQDIAAECKAKHGLHHPRRVHSRWLLSGLVRCAECDTALVGDERRFKRKHRLIKTDTEKVYPVTWMCYTHRARPGGCKTGEIPMDMLHARVMARVHDFITKPENLRAIYKTLDVELSKLETGAGERLEKLKRDQAATHREIGRMVAAIRSAGHSQAMIAELARLENLEQEQKTDIAKLEDQNRIERRALPVLTDAQLDDIGQGLIGRLASEGLREQQTVLRGLIKSIHVGRTGQQRKIDLYGEIVFRLPPPINQDELEFTLPL